MLGIADLKYEFLIESIAPQGSQSKIHTWIMQRPAMLWF